ncbi:MAG: hypothetical protein ABSG34_05100 [Candidatus Sulfotelmatobacter sp.]
MRRAEIGVSGIFPLSQVERIISPAMEVDRETLIKLLEAFVDASELLQRELMLYQILFQAACKTSALGEDGMKELVDRGRKASAQKIKESSQASYRDLLAKVPQIVDLLDTNRDEAMRILREWKPKGPMM